MALQGTGGLPKGGRCVRRSSGGLKRCGFRFLCAIKIWVGTKARRNRSAQSFGYFSVSGPSADWRLAVGGYALAAAGWATAVGGHWISVGWLLSTKYDEIKQLWRFFPMRQSLALALFNASSLVPVPPHPICAPLWHCTPFPIGAALSLCLSAIALWCGSAHLFFRVGTFKTAAAHCLTCRPSRPCPYATRGMFLCGVLVQGSAAGSGHRLPSVRKDCYDPTLIPALPSAEHGH